MDPVGFIILGLLVFLMLSACVAFAIFRYQTRRAQPKKSPNDRIREQIRAELASEEMRELIRAEIRTELTKEKLRAEIRAELEAELADLAKAQAVGTKNHTTMF
jgi:flagellar basal body-associated protein FliL